MNKIFITVLIITSFILYQMQRPKLENWTLALT